MVERLRRGQRHYQHVIQEAIGGGTCEHRPGGCQEEECPFTMPAVVAAEAAFEQGDFSEAADLFGAELDKGCEDCPRDGEYRKYPKWREATLRVLKARSLRRARLLHQATATLDPVMHLCCPAPPYSCITDGDRVPDSCSARALSHFKCRFSVLFESKEGIRRSNARARAPSHVRHVVLVPRSCLMRALRVCGWIGACGGNAHVS
jgi:hypothetical protein